MPPIEKDKLFSRLPPEWSADLLPEIRAAVTRSPRKSVVLDDDPTGTQTVSGIDVITRWDIELLVQVLVEPDPLVYILTNSRSFPLNRAREMNLEILTGLKEASRLTNRPFTLISRSDSTLRGHFPGEVQALQEGLDEAVDGILLVPFFEDGGRFTIADVHYVAEGGFLIPAGETEYARDAVFGYHASNLRQWVSEKYANRILPDEVASIDLVTLRGGGPAVVAGFLRKMEKGQFCVVNAASYRDLEVLVAGLLQVEADGKRFLVRSAASFVRVRLGQSPHPLLTSVDLQAWVRSRGGLVVAGSYIRKSTDQIASLQLLQGMTNLELSVNRLLDPISRESEIIRVTKQADDALEQDADVLVYTSRELVTGRNPETSLLIGEQVSTALVEVVRRIQHRPAWLLAKGGITSSDIATQGLHTRRARVLGQILPGVPVWLMGEASRWAGLVYVVFPGNVGQVGDMAEAVSLLRRAAD